MTSKLLTAVVVIGFALGVVVSFDQPAQSQQSQTARYTVSSSSGVAYVVNTETGAVRYCDKGGCYPIADQQGTIRLPN